MITVGIVLATLSAPSRRSAAVTTSATAPTSERSWAPTEYAAGIAVLMLALLLSSLLGLFQEETYRRYGKAWQEGLFYSVSHLFTFVCSSLTYSASPVYPILPPVLSHLNLDVQILCRLSANCSLHAPDQVAR